MSRDRLTYSGSRQNLRENNKIFSQKNVTDIQRDENKQLRRGQDENNAYKSEEHRQVYQNTSQSFNEHRDQYAEMALDALFRTTGYDYQAVIPGNIEESPEPYQRYISKSSAGTGGNSDSIFMASELELADATENYIKKDSDEFAKRLATTDKQISKTQNSIDRIEIKGLQYSDKHKRFIRGENNEKLLSRTCERSYYGKGRKREIYVTAERQLPGRLKFRSEKTAMSEKAHHKAVKEKESAATRRGYYLRQLGGDIKNTFSESSFQEDEISVAMRNKRKKASFAVRRAVRKNARKLKHTFDGYNRLKFQSTHLASLKAQKELLNYRSGIDRQRRKAEEAARQGLIRENRKRKVKKELVQKYKREQGNLFTRTVHQQKLKKTVKKEQKMAKQRTKAIISSGLFFVMLLLLIIMIIFLFITVLLNMGGESIANSVSQNDYSDMTDVTAYFRDKEADLQEAIKPENLEPVILGEYPEIFEFIYDMAEISFDANTLVAYLSAKYNEFDLDMVMADMDEIFEAYYTLKWEVKEEYRLIPDPSGLLDPETGEPLLIEKLVQICYVTLEKADFYELLQSRIDDAAKQNQMDGFYLSGNGQQVYGPVMNVDWRNKISSNYGWRIHPITGVRTFHDGVDIAVPTGTPLYSAVTGTVVSSHYSDSAGNMVVIQNESGWRVTFMHMDSRAVSVGETIEQGQFVGYSGNTGNSTGPHLHIRIHDADDKPINPVFIVPFSTIEASETFK